MKRAVIACALLAATVVGCIALHCAVMNRMARLEQGIAGLLQLCETATPGVLAEEARALLQSSASTLRLLHCTAGHETVDALAQRLETLPYLAADRADCRAHCAEALVLLNALRQAQRVDLENILFFHLPAVR